MPFQSFRKMNQFFTDPENGLRLKVTLEHGVAVSDIEERNDALSSQESLKIATDPVTYVNISVMPKEDEPMPKFAERFGVSGAYSASRKTKGDALADEILHDHGIMVLKDTGTALTADAAVAKVTKILGDRGHTISPAMLDEMKTYLGENLTEAARKEAATAFERTGGKAAGALSV